MKKEEKNIYQNYLLPQFTSYNKRIGKKQKLDDEIIIHLVDNQLQMTEKDTCCIYQIQIYLNLVKPIETNKIINNKKLHKKQWKNY